MREWIDLAAEAMGQPHRRVVVVTGAGISVASGIPTFRGPEPDAVWANDVLEKGTRRFFTRDPVASWSWYLRRFDRARTAQPNPGHTALTEIQRHVVARDGRLTVVTQNVDGLHTAAGTTDVIEVHGSARHVRCSRTGCEHGEPRGVQDWDEGRFAAFRAEPRLDTLPRCVLCRSVLRPHVLWFDESYNDHVSYGFDAVCEAMFAPPAMLVFVGTSFAVGITELVLNTAVSDGIPMWVVDPILERPPRPQMELIRAPSEVFLPAVAERMRDLG